MHTASERVDNSDREVHLEALFAALPDSMDAIYRLPEAWKDFLLKDGRRWEATDALFRELYHEAEKRDSIEGLKDLLKKAEQIATLLTWHRMGRLYAGPHHRGLMSAYTNLVVFISSELAALEPNVVDQVEKIRDSVEEGLAEAG